MENTIRLNFINRSDDANNSNIVIFSKNEGKDPSTAWLVFNNPAIGESNPFTYFTDVQISASDGNGNFLPMLEAHKGERFHILKTSDAEAAVQYKGPASTPDVIEFENNLTDGVVRVRLYNNGSLFREVRGLWPDAVTTFDLKPQIWCASTELEINAGDNIPSEVVERANMMFDLTDIDVADIVMTGGTDIPHIFNLEDVVEKGATPENGNHENTDIFMMPENIENQTEPENQVTQEEEAPAQP